MTTEPPWLFTWKPTDEEPPPILYHYTSFDGFLGILHRKAIWASSIMHLNDALEITFSLERFLQRAQKMATTPATDEQRLFLQGLGNFLRERLAVENPAYQRAQAVNCYVSSFCRKGDRLSQWRAYCPSGGGVCVGFNSQKVREVAEHQGFGLGRCRYTEADQDPLIDDVIASLLTHLKSGVSSVGLDQAARTEFAGALGGKTLGFYYASGPLYDLAALLKHPGFLEEEEWRLSSRGWRPKQEMHYRATSTTIVPYVEVALSLDGSPIPIDEVIVGPGPLKNLTRVTVQDLLGVYGLDARLATRESEIEYRPWR